MRAFYPVQIGPPHPEAVTGAGQSAASLATAGNGACIRFLATRNLPVTGVRLRFGGSGVGTIAVRLETIDTSTGKPTGALYDPNAEATGVTVSTAVTGQVIMFPTAPITPLSLGTWYGLVVLAEQTGSKDLRYGAWVSGITQAAPVGVLTAADATNRANLTYQASSHPLIVFHLANGETDSMGTFPWVANPTAHVLYGQRWGGNVVTIPHQVTIHATGVRASLYPTGTPAGDAVLRILRGSGGVVYEQSIPVAMREQMASGRGMWLPLARPVRLDPGQYRVVWGSPNSINASNCWTLTRVQTMGTGPYTEYSSYHDTLTPNDGTTWSDTLMNCSAVALVGDLAEPLILPRSRGLRMEGAYGI